MTTVPSLTTEGDPMAGGGAAAPTGVPSDRLKGAASTAFSACLWMLAWVWHVRSDPPAQGLLLVYLATIFVLASIASLLVAHVERVLLSGSEAQSARFCVIAAASSAMFALLTLVPADDMRLRWVFVLGVAPLALHLALVASFAKVDRRQAMLALVAAGTTGVLVVVFWITRVDVPTAELVWYPSDQRLYARLANGLVRGKLEKSKYPPGLATVLSPFVMLSDSDAPGSSVLASSNRLNAAVLPAMLSVVAMGFFFVGQAIRAAWRQTSRAMAVAQAAFPAVVAAAYIALPPGFVLDRNARLVPRRLLGLVFAAEPFTYLYVAAAFLLLVKMVNSTNLRWNPWLVGFASGLVVAMRESNVFFVVLFLGVLLLVRGHRVRAVQAALGAAAVMFCQMLYFQRVYGDVVLPNRGTYDGSRWRALAESRYSWNSSQDPPQISPDYIKANLGDLMMHYWPLVLLTVGSAVVAVVCLRRLRWVWTFLMVTTAIYVVFHSAYVHHQPIFRYNWVVTPGVTLLLGVGGTWLAERGLGYRRRAPRPPTPEPATAV